MKLKYQMRGLGIGIIVTAILMGVTTSHGIPLTDAEIRARALELGMVESSSLKLTDVGGRQTPAPGSQGEKEESSGSQGQELDSSGTGNGSQGREPDPSGTGSGSQGREPDPSGTGSGSQGQEPDPSGMGSGSQGREPDPSGTGSGSQGREPDPGAEEPDPDSPEGDAPAHVTKEGDHITVVIEPGTDSYAISEVLAEAGLVEDAKEFDDFLCNNLYSRNIVDGTYEIPAGAGNEEIARIITRQKKQSD